MEKLKNLHDVSSFYFFVMAFAYVVMVLAFRNGYIADFMLSLMRILDLPFAFVSLLYGGTTLALQLKFDKDKNVRSSGWALLIFGVCTILFGLIAFVNFGFPPVI